MIDVTLNNLCGGILQERFEQHKEAVLENIADSNVPARGKRSIIFQIDMEPSDTRDAADVTITSKVKLVGPKGARSHAYLGQDNGKLVMRDLDAAQQQLFQHTEVNADVQ